MNGRSAIRRSKMCFSPTRTAMGRNRRSSTRRRGAPEAEMPGPSMVTTAVEVDGLTRVFGDFVAVDHIDLRVDAGTVFGFLGPNGAGKSTTIRMLCGILRPSAGRALVGGYDIVTQTDQVKNSIGYMSQKFSLYEDLTVEENLRFFAGIYGVQGNQRA